MDDLEKFLMKIVFLILWLIVLLPFNFLFIFAWNHSLTELWPHVVPNIGYWQGYLLLLVLRNLFPLNYYIIKNEV